MMRTVEFTEPVFHSTVLFLYGTADELERWGKTSNFARTVADHLVQDHCAYAGRCSQVSRGHHRVEIIWVKPTTHTQQLAITIAHECLHAVHSVLGDCGLTFSDDSQEAYAYLHSYYMTECLRVTTSKYKRRTKRR